jgi:ABC-type glycerol-3-phosphate transport system substrate-binding protein
MVARVSVCTMTHLISVRIAVFGLALIAAACSNDTTTPSSTSSTTTTTTPVTTPTASETFASTLAIGGAAFYSFNIAENGTVNVTLNSVGGTGVPATVQLGLGIGTPAGVDCSTTSTVTAGAGTAPQLTGTFGPGLFCVRVYDVGNLAAPATFRVTIAHS